MPNDNQISMGDDQLRSRGFADPERARRNLDLIARALGPGPFSSAATMIIERISVAADSDTALNNLERFVGALPDPPSFLQNIERHRHLLPRLVTLLGASRFLSIFLMSRAEEALTWLADDEFVRTFPGREELADELAAVAGPAKDDREFQKALRQFRKRCMLRIALRDLLGAADLREVTAALSDLAEVCLQTAYERAAAALTGRHGRPLVLHDDGSATPAGFAVIAMGKLGGRELNFSSDVDLLYVYEADGETEGVSLAGGNAVNTMANRDYFTKLGEMISAAIGAATEDGFVFRVDLRLRPEGQGGPLAQSLYGYELYYESWGQTWERAALIKARPVAGDEATGQEFLKRIAPFVYRKYLDYSAIGEIGDMKRKINRDAEMKHKAFRNVKLGTGGIREIEFVIQSLQLIYGGRDRSLRERSSLKALHQLSQKELISYREYEDLAKAYVFLRTVEHRIQVLDDLQSQMMPADEAGLRLLARRTGYRGADETRQLLADYEAHTRNVRSVFDDLLTFKSDDTSSMQRDASLLLLDPETTEQEGSALLAREGFVDPDKAYRNIRLLQEGPAFVHQTPRSRKLFQELFPLLFSTIAASHDPDTALSRIESFLAENGSWEALQSLAGMDREAISVLIAVFATSEYLSRLLIGRPQYLQHIIETRTSRVAGASARLAHELDAVLSRSTDVAEKLNVLRIFKHQEEIRIGMADLLSGMSLPAISRDLSRLAEVCLDAALKMAGEEAVRRYGLREHPRGLAVIGAGRLGGRELIYGSDLDILFVFAENEGNETPEGITRFELYNKIAEKTISYLSSLTREGFVFRVDTRLRPDGTKGPLAQSIETYERYFASHAATWELQAMLKARFAAGDRSTGRRFCAAVRQELMRTRDRDRLAHDVLAMRGKMETELGGEQAAAYNIKQGTGGLVDIEFLVQFLQLRHGCRHPAAVIPGTSNALRMLRREGLLDERAFQLLWNANRFLRLIESKIRIISNQAAVMLPNDPEKVKSLASRLGYTNKEKGAGTLLLDDYRKMRQEVRSLFETVIRSGSGAEKGFLY